MPIKFETGPGGRILDYYAVFGVVRDASTQAIQSAYRRKSLKCHPDKFPNDKVKEADFKQLGAIKTTLCDQRERERYDQALACEVEGEIDRLQGSRESVGAHQGRGHQVHAPTEWYRDCPPVAPQHGAGRHEDTRHGSQMHSSRSSNRREYAGYESGEQSDHDADEDRYLPEYSRSRQNSHRQTGRSRYNRPPTPSADYAPRALLGGYRRPAPSYRLEPFWSMRHQDRVTRECFREITARCAGICGLALASKDILDDLERVARREYEASKVDRRDAQGDCMVSKLCVVIDILYQILDDSSVCYRRILDKLDDVVVKRGDCIPLLRDIDRMTRDLKANWQDTEDRLCDLDKRIERDGMGTSAMVREIERLLMMWDRTCELPRSMREAIDRVMRSSRFSYVSTRYNYTYYVDLTR